MPTRVTAGRLTRALQAASIAFAFAVAVAAGVARASGEWAGIVGGTATKVPRLGTGDLAGFVSPASPPYDIYDPASYVPHVVESMASLGLNATFGAHAFVQMGYVLGWNGRDARQ
ncbi:hypothetical protein Pelo_13678 [Pelomyxa schiedti]|nr:hypothetical protein Pelo_13678 [Pelomyxa schiedti]